MNVTDFQRRAFAAGCSVRVSGTHLFYSRDGVTVRIKIDVDGTTHYAKSELEKGRDVAFKPCTVAQASKALSLPRKD